MRTLSKHIMIFSLLGGICSCVPEQAGEGGSETKTVQLNLKSSGDGESKARLIFWEEGTYHNLPSAAGIPYCVALPENSIDTYSAENSNRIPYNTGVPYPAIGSLHLCGYAPQDMDPEGGNPADLYQGDYRRIPVPARYQDGKTDFLSCAGSSAGSAQLPFDRDMGGGQRENQVFKHACSRLIFKIRRDPATLGHMMFRNIRITLPDGYMPGTLAWDQSGYKLAGTESSTTSFAQGGLQSRLHDRILQIEDEILLDTLYVAPCDPQTLEWRDASILLRVVADRSPDNFSSFIEEGKQWDIPVPITKNGISVSSLSPGKGYVITIEFSLNSFQIQAEEEDWEEHVLIDIPIVDHG